jgi:DNA invertase Pin-like site-specific DNA recombinase
VVVLLGRELQNGGDIVGFETPCVARNRERWQPSARPPEKMPDLTRRLIAGFQVFTEVEYVDHGISGTKETRPSLDRMLKDVRRRKVDLVIVWSLDRLGRSLRHLIGLLDEVQSLGVGFVSLKEGLDCTTAAGRLQWQIIGAISEFERARRVERVRAGLERAKAQGTRLGRPSKRPTPYALDSVAHLSTRAAALKLGISKSVIAKARLSEKPVLLRSKNALNVR